MTTNDDRRILALILEQLSEIAGGQYDSDPDDEDLDDLHYKALTMSPTPMRDSLLDMIKNMRHLDN